jgi:hypothetical protein
MVWADFKSNVWSLVIPAVWVGCLLGCFFTFEAARSLQRELVSDWERDRPIIHVVSAGPPHRPRRARALATIATATTLRAFFALVLVLSFRASRPGRALTISRRPSAPAISSIAIAIPFSDVEERLLVSPITTPCTLKAAAALPAGPRSDIPILVPEPQRVVFRTRTRDPNTLEIFLEVSVVNRGDVSIAKDWRLCLVHDGKPLRYRAEELTAEDLSGFKDKSSLQHISRSMPIERGHMAAGWLLFRVPKEAVGNFDGSLECRDYLGRRYSSGFVSRPR